MRGQKSSQGLKDNTSSQTTATLHLSIQTKYTYNNTTIITQETTRIIQRTDFTQEGGCKTQATKVYT